MLYPVIFRNWKNTDMSLVEIVGSIIKFCEKGGPLEIEIFFSETATHTPFLGLCLQPKAIDLLNLQHRTFLIPGSNDNRVKLFLITILTFHLIDWFANLKLFIIVNKNEKRIEKRKRSEH